MYRMLSHPPYHFGWLVFDCCGGYYALVYTKYGETRQTKVYKTYTKADNAGKELFKNS